MAWTEPRTWVTGEVLTKANLDAQIRDNLNYLKVTFPSMTAVELTIAGGVITKAYYHHTVDTEANAASDELVTINGGSEGEILLIRPSNSARTIVLRHNIGNIWSPHGMDLSLEDADSYALLAYSGSKWCIIGAGGGAFTNLNDVPNSYAGAGGFVVSVTDEADGLEFIDPTTLPVASHDLGNHTAAQSDVDFNRYDAKNFAIEGLEEELTLTLGRIYRETTGKKRLMVCKEDL